MRRIRRDAAGNNCRASSAGTEASLTESARASFCLLQAVPICGRPLLQGPMHPDKIARRPVNRRMDGSARLINFLHLEECAADDAAGASTPETGLRRRLRQFSVDSNQGCAALDGRLRICASPHAASHARIKSLGPYALSAAGSESVRRQRRAPGSPNASPLA